MGRSVVRGGEQSAPAVELTRASTEKHLAKIRALLSQAKRMYEKSCTSGSAESAESAETATETKPADNKQR